MDVVLYIMVQLFLFSLPLLAIELSIAMHDQKKKCFPIRLCITTTLYFVFSLFIVGLIYRGRIYYTNDFMYIAIFCFSFLLIWLCFDIRLIDIVFITTCAYAVQHIGYSVGAILYLIMDIESLNVRYIVSSFSGQVIIGVVFYYFYKKNYMYARENKDKDIRILALAIINLFLTIYLSNLVTATTENGPIEIFLICKIYAIICCTLVIIIEFMVFKLNIFEKKNSYMEQIIQTQGAQAQLTKDSIEIINRKCHDIKYQMRALQIIDDPEKRKVYIDELQKAISIYDSIYRTENEVLNLIIREKQLICKEYDIQFSCMADGEILAFFEFDDLYVLFSNALDNAIESVLKESDLEKRIISLKIGSRSGVEFIHLENYCNDNIIFDKGKPKTTKDNKKNHGFGIMSMEYICDKYDGEMIMQYENNTFYLDLFFNQ